jgi:hypothetical protein
MPSVDMATSQEVPTDLDAWCLLHLGSAPAESLFGSRRISDVRAVRLGDGREVVIKVRPPAERLSACVFVQRYANERGFPCPEPLAGPAPLGDVLATAETYMPDGDELEPRGAGAEYGVGLAWLVSLVPASVVSTTLEPVPYWMNWDHSLEGTWSPDPNVDLNSRQGPDWLDHAGLVARERLKTADALPEAIGHGDWESQNLRWRGRELYVAHDWDSVVRRPEALVAGMTSLIFTSTREKPNQAATIEDSEVFLESYQTARDRRFSRDETELAWAAGLWLGAWKAKKALFYDDPTIAAELAQQVDERVRRIGG